MSVPVTEGVSVFRRLLPGLWYEIHLDSASTVSFGTNRLYDPGVGAGVLENPLSYSLWTVPCVPTDVGMNATDVSERPY